MELVGKVKVINAEQQVGASFKKRELVVTTDEQYPQHIMIEFTQDKCDLLNKYAIGDAVKVSINLGGREWVNPQGETKYFNSIKGWRIEKQTILENQMKNNETGAEYKQPFETTNNVSDEDHDDLPF